MNCKSLQSRLPDLIIDPTLAASPEIVAHRSSCAACERECAELERTFHLLDLWASPEPSPYFDQRLAVLIREEQARPQLSWFGRLREHLVLNTGPQFRPALAGALALVLVAGGGGILHISHFHQNASIQTSAAVNDLQILDKNDQTIQQMDQLLQDDAANQNGPLAPPAS